MAFDSRSEGLRWSDVESDVASIVPCVRSMRLATSHDVLGDVASTPTWCPTTGVPWTRF